VATTYANAAIFAEDTVFSARPGEEVYRLTKERFEQLKKERDASEAASALENLKRVLEGENNVMPAMIRAVKAGYRRRDRRPQARGARHLGAPTSTVDCGEATVAQSRGLRAFKVQCALFQTEK